MSNTILLKNITISSRRGACINAGHEVFQVFADTLEVNIGRTERVTESMLEPGDDDPIAYLRRL